MSLNDEDIYVVVVPFTSLKKEDVIGDARIDICEKCMTEVWRTTETDKIFHASDKAHLICVNCAIVQDGTEIIDQVFARMDLVKGHPRMIAMNKRVREAADYIDEVKSDPNLITEELIAEMANLLVEHQDLLIELVQEQSQELIDKLISEQ